MEELRQTPLTHATHQAVVRVILVAHEVVFVHHLNTWVFSILKAVRQAGRQAGRQAKNRPKDVVFEIYVYILNIVLHQLLV